MLLRYKMLTNVVTKFQYVSKQYCKGDKNNMSPATSGPGKHTIITAKQFKKITES